MERRGGDLHAGREDSARRAASLDALERELATLRFPISKADLLDKKGEVRLALPARRVGSVTLKGLLANLNTTEFTSPEHVTEVLKINWQDFADVFTLGAGDVEPPDLRGSG